jgi:predicted membrane protein
MPIELISAIVGFLLTLMILSYLIGDNPAFRVALYLFIGVSSGYAATVVVYNVLMPKLVDAQTNFLLFIPLVLGATLFAKLSPRTSWIGNFAMAMLVGVGAATALAGALLGTLIPQAQAAMDAFDLRSSPLGPALQFLQAVIMLVGTVVTLAAFQFSAKRTPDGTVKRNALLEGVAWVGRLFIAITLGVLFAGVYMAALTAMLERLSALLNFIRSLIGI